MSAIPAMPDWFPDGKVDPDQVLILSRVFIQTAKQNGFTRETYAVAVAQCAKALCVPDEHDIDRDVKRFVSERLMASSIGLAGGSQ